MSKINDFRIKIADTYDNIDYGMDSMIFFSEGDSTKIAFVVNGERKIIDVSDREKEIISAIEETGIMKYNNLKVSNNWAVDGYHWFVEIDFDGQHVRVAGNNAYPKEFEKLIEYLHRKWKIPYPNALKHSKQESKPNFWTKEPYIER